MKISAIQCNAECEDIIYSRAHDFRSCSCGHCSIDGGFEYVKVSGLFFTYGQIELNVTKATLHKDWNTSNDKYGKISKDEQLRIGISLEKEGLQYTDGDT
jgi:hypothetical protein